MTARQVAASPARPVQLPDGWLALPAEDLGVLLSWAREGVASARRAEHPLSRSTLALLAAAGHAVAAARTASGPAVADVDNTGARLTVTIKEAAKMIGMTEGHVRKLCRSGELPAARRGRDWLLDAAIVSTLAQSRRTS